MGVPLPCKSRSGVDDATRDEERCDDDKVDVSHCKSVVYRVDYLDIG